MTIKEFVAELAKHRDKSVWSLVGSWGPNGRWGLSIRLQHDRFPRDVIRYVAWRKLGSDFCQEDDFNDVIPVAATKLGLSCADANKIICAADDISGHNRRLRRALLRATNFHHKQGLLNVLA